MFGNANICDNYTGGSAAELALSGKMCDAWINLGRHVDPKHSGLPNWPPCTRDTGQGMIFDETCLIKNNPERKGRRLAENA